MSLVRCAAIVLLVALLSGCGDNLTPSGSDLRPALQPGSTGPAVGQSAPPFAVSDSSGATVTLTTALAGRKGIVLYCTMWCSSCEEQTAQLQSMAASFPEVGFYLVDYVSGTVTEAATAAVANGVTGAAVVTLADTEHALLNAFQGTMGTTVLVDAAGVVRMNEDFRDGARLRAMLGAPSQP
ncbi:peroxiredoxin family protein [Geomonas subterranea]|uniref:Peroxiredoxin family protein n=1 Tax=Geomonas subterranea TaxID=2847989 RepID=A0ABX8LHF7_9BACT|nr:redoxin domain-containing protein [Geomonas subterranea]QXE91402.1 peroxiredoxin family protein [Geomonas subterranea]QXM10510.1 peroxiredoxin family protein [Geomonas subterranea]